MLLETFHKNKRYVSNDKRIGTFIIKDNISTTFIVNSPNWSEISFMFLSNFLSANKKKKLSPTKTINRKYHFFVSNITRVGYKFS